MSGNNISENITAKELQEYLKNNDTAVSIVGEVEADDVIARKIQMGQFSSLFTLFSHHSKTRSELSSELRKNLLPNETVINSGGET